MQNVNNLSTEEQVTMALRGLYERSGYTRFKMGKFEEYDLYARNKDFLTSDHIITFTENGKLMALKPDVTLSIVRAGRDVPGAVQKLYYTENVYRVSGNTDTFREIMQTGLECIGSIDDCSVAEVVVLAARSLKLISEDCSFVLSHTGVVAELLDRAGLTGEDRDRALRFIGEKNGHELKTLLEAAAAPTEAGASLLRLIRLNGGAQEVLAVLEELQCGDGAIAQLKVLVAALESAGCGDILRLDFSVVNNMHYYNGVVFKGFVSGVPVSVLSGGRYDRLLKKMGRSSGAIGFAVYLDTIELMNRETPEYDVDTVLLYDETQAPAEVLQAAEDLKAEGSVMLARIVPEKLRCRRVLRFDGREDA